MIMQVAKGKNKSRNVFAAGFKFTEGNDKRFQWEINEAIEMATSAQVSLAAYYHAYYQLTTYAIVQSVEQTSLDAKIARAREIRRLKVCMHMISNYISIIIKLIYYCRKKGKKTKQGKEI